MSVTVAPSSNRRGFFAFLQVSKNVCSLALYVLENTFAVFVCLLESDASQHPFKKYKLRIYLDFLAPSTSELKSEVLQASDWLYFLITLFSSSERNCNVLPFLYLFSYLLQLLIKGSLATIVISRVDSGDRSDSDVPFISFQDEYVD